MHEADQYMSKRDRYLRTALAVADIWSKDPSTQVGALAVGASPNQVAWGYNGLPPGLDDSRDRLHTRDVKNALTVHAEVNALMNATFPVETLYVTHCPCEGCAKLILAARSVKKVVFMGSSEDFYARWKDSNEKALALFTEAGIIYEEVTW